MLNMNTIMTSSVDPSLIKLIITIMSH